MQEKTDRAEGRASRDVGQRKKQMIGQAFQSPGLVLGRAEGHTWAGSN